MSYGPAHKPISVSKPNLPWTDFVAGVRAVVPISIGVIPFGLITGVSMIDAGIPPLHAIGMTVVSFSGAAQLAAIDLINSTAPVAVVVVTALVINLRFIMYSASIAPYFRQFEPLARWFGAYLITDEAYAVSIVRFRRWSGTERDPKWFYFGTAITFWATWHGSATAGVLLGTSVLSGLSLEFAVRLTFIALLVPAVDDRPTGVAAVTAAGASVLVSFFPFNLGFVAATLLGIAGGVVFEIHRDAFPQGAVVRDSENDTASERDSGC